MSESIVLVLVGAVVGAALIGGFVFLDDSGGVEADKVCSERFGDDWRGERADTNPNDGEVVIECTNGEETKQIGVNVGVNL